MNAKQYLLDHWIKNKIWTHLEWPKHQKRLSQCASHLSGSTFCDVGCGLGHSTEIMGRYKKGKWHGIEFFKEAVKKATELFPDIKFYYCDNNTFDMSLSTGMVFDGVICSEVIEHVEKPVLLVKNLWKITAKRMVLTTPGKYVNDPGHLRVYTKQMLQSLMVKAGVEKFTIMLDDPFWYIVGRRN